jgi:hypothetical protein
LSVLMFLHPRQSFPMPAEDSHRSRLMLATGYPNS